MREKIRRWLSKNFTWKGIAALFVFLVKIIPDALGWANFWSTTLPPVGKFLARHSTPFVAIAVGLAIWLDHRRVLAKRREKKADEGLRGRTRAFCDELRDFKKELGPEPAINWTPSNTVKSFTDGNQKLIEREQRMHHGFHLRFYDKAVHLWHEHGAEMRESKQLASALAARVDTDEQLNTIIEMFSELAKDEN